MIMSHKIRKAMGERERLYMLSGKIEADDFFWELPMREVGIVARN